MAISVVPHTEEVSQAVVDMLLQIVASSKLVHDSVWLWLTRVSALPPVSRGRSDGSYVWIVKTVRGLKDAEILKSYLLLLWSEWGPLAYSGFDEMCASVHEDFCGIGMGHHRADLIHRLDHILGRLDQGLEYLKQHKPDLEDHDIQDMRRQYGVLKGVLLETNIEVIARMSHPMVVLLRHGILTQATHIESRTASMCALPLLCP